MQFLVSIKDVTVKVTRRKRIEQGIMLSVLVSSVSRRKEKLKSSITTQKKHLLFKKIGRKIDSTA